MQNWKKRTLSVILALCTIAVLLPAAPALAADTEADTVTIDGTLGGKTTATEEDVNALVDQLKAYVDNGITTIIVTGSEPALYNFYGIDTSAVSAALYYLADGNSDSPYCGTIDLILPDITEIVDDEFNNTYALNSITLPKVTKLGDLAFYATPYLRTITFGSVLTEVNETGGVMFYWVGKEVGGCDLILNCGQMDSRYIPNLENNTWNFRFTDANTFKSITLTHGDSEHTTATDNGDGTHSFTCTVCGGTGTKDHTTELEENKATCTTLTVCDICSGEYGKILDHVMDPSTGLCGNGCMKLMAVASATIDGSTSYHETLDGAISLVSSATAEDDAEVKLLDGLTRTNGVYINRGVFTLDLNSKTLTSAEDVLMVSGSANVTIRNGTITSTIMLIPSVSADGSTVTLEDCSIIGGNFGVNVDAGATVTIRNSTVTGNNEHGVVVHDGTVTIENSTIEGKDIGVIAYDTTTISGGSVTGGNFDLYGDAIELTLNGDGKGTTFPGGICVGNCTLDALLADELAYWQDGKMVILTIEQDTIPGGDVTVMAACDHSGNTNTRYTDNGDGTHSFECTVCGPVTEDHTPDETIGQTCKGYWCTVCENWYGEALGHNFVNGICTLCGDQLTSRFEDVAAGQFFFDPVEWAVENGITTGATETTFNPNGQCQRAAVVTFLWRAAGSPEPTSTENPFVDVPSNAFYYKAVLWAVENNITNGISATEFGVNTICNRAQVVTFLYRTQTK